MRTNLVLLLTCTTLAATWAFVGYSERNPPQPLARPLGDIPKKLDGWTSVDDPPLTANILRSLNATALLSRTYRRENREANLFVAFYEKQQVGVGMHSPKYCLPGGGWEPLESTVVAVPTARGEALINKYVLQMGGAKTLVLYWYQSPGRVIASEYTARAFLVWDGLTRRRNGGSIVRLTLSNTPEAPRDGLLLVPAVIAEMQRCLGG